MFAVVDPAVTRRRPRGSTTATVPAIGLAIVACSTAWAATMTCNAAASTAFWYATRSAADGDEFPLAPSPPLLRMACSGSTACSGPASAPCRRRSQPDAAARCGEQRVERGRCLREGRLARRDLLLRCHHRVEGGAARGEVVGRRRRCRSSSVVSLVSLPRLRRPRRSAWRSRAPAARRAGRHRPGVARRAPPVARPRVAASVSLTAGRVRAW